MTAIAGDPARNLDFYTRVLGLRFVKRTVNYDDPGTYHFYFGDGAGTPGSILTFFPWPRARRGRAGAGQVAVTSFAVAPGAIGFWIERLLRMGIAYRGPASRPGEGEPGERLLAFEDPDGLMLELVADPRAPVRPDWDGGPDIPAESAIRGFHSVTLWSDAGEATERVLVETLGFRPVRDGEGVRRFEAGEGGPSRIVNVRSVGGFPKGVTGTGVVHHVAWRAGDDADELALRDRVVAAGFDPTPVIDRTYFHSVYFREPGGVLFELATDHPGFAVDEPAESLGARLILPAHLETRRPAIEAGLPSLHLGGPGSAFADAELPDDLGFVHRFHPAQEAASSNALLLLHGTGGDEDDLISLGRLLQPGAAQLSPRGNVLE
ncbi:MAG: VOC family protein, partial [Gemmatimonadales bacterium]